MECQQQYSRGIPEFGMRKSTLILRFQRKTEMKIYSKIILLYGLRNRLFSTRLTVHMFTITQISNATSISCLAQQAL